MINIFKSVQRGEYQSSTLEKAISSGKVSGTPGNVIEADFIRVESVPIVSPAGDVLLVGMSFEVQPGSHLLVTGPNGAGKSSLFQDFGGTMAIFGGHCVQAECQRYFLFATKTLPLCG